MATARSTAARWAPLLWCASPRWAPPELRARAGARALPAALRLARAHLRGGPGARESAGGGDGQVRSRLARHEGRGRDARALAGRAGAAARCAGLAAVLPAGPRPAASR